ncbi:unnamed protein product [Kuraishia capsulata CBS 1993]|uniref:Protein kinase domain-containing protein n=1 Tax=Kuraishia capsulata CBS 1993 TaxID=1382522 RepID=W6MRY8_9ASCO|nr:uncharacterized protein KUCA_T00005140001 [Kuraishia capsulata CBS 1993]CDK29153.1 unnamed protein product [Kuraishia capsulata CBS 1993]
MSCNTQPISTHGESRLLLRAVSYYLYQYQPQRPRSNHAKTVAITSTTSFPAAMSMVDSSNRKRPREFADSNTGPTSASAQSQTTTTATDVWKSHPKAFHNHRYGYGAIPHDEDVINLISDDENYAFAESPKGSKADTDTNSGLMLPEDFAYLDNDSSVALLDDDDDEDILEAGSGSDYGAQRFAPVADTDEDSRDFIARGNARTFRTASASSYSGTNFMTKPAKPFKKPRTNSLPQLPHTRVSYQPPPTLHEAVTKKVGDVKTNFIPYQNYTFGIAARKTSLDSTSLDSGSPKRLDFGHQKKQQRNSQNPNNRQLTEETCDDSDGHYVIKPGDLFANNRFKFQKLLGQGTFGKVVSAVDMRSQSVCAIKIIRAIPKYREASKIELRVLSTIKKHDPMNRNHCIHLRECFDYRGHICIVTDLLKVSLFDFLENNRFFPFPGSHIQAIAKQLLRSVAFLHDLNLIHTDLKPENVLLQDDSYTKKPFEGRSYRKVLTDPCIYTIDFGSAIFSDEYHSVVVSTRHYRAPEIILGIGWSFPCDLWSVGCILVELATGDALFKTHSNLEHLALMEKILQQKLDVSLVAKCKARRRRNSGQQSQENVADLFSPAGRLVFPGRETTPKSIEEVAKAVTLDELIGSRCGFRIDTKLSLEENYSRFGVKRIERDSFKFWFYFIDLIKRLLAYDPDRRLKAVDALEHRWFDLGIYDDGTV